MARVGNRVCWRARVVVGSSPDAAVAASVERKRRRSTVGRDNTGGLGKTAFRLFVPQGFDRIHVGGALSGIDTENDPDAE